MSIPKEQDRQDYRADAGSQPISANPCLACGACCAYYRASFYWREADDTTPGGVPVQLTQDLSPFRRVMRGTDQKAPRCVALQGEIGRHTRCSIYERRPNVCRSFTPSYAHGIPNPDCDKARRHHGLAPLTPDDWRQTPESTGPAAPSTPRAA